MTAVQVAAKGAGGGKGGNDATRPGSSGLSGGSVVGSIVVTPGEVLSISVGCAGKPGLSSAKSAAGGAGGWGGVANGGSGGAAGPAGTSGGGGGGGGGTVVQITRGTSTFRLIAAGGGGGGGAGYELTTLGASTATNSVLTAGQAGQSLGDATNGSFDGGGGGGGGGGFEAGSGGKTVDWSKCSFQYYPGIYIPGGWEYSWSQYMYVFVPGYYTPGDNIVVCNDGSSIKTTDITAGAGARGVSGDNFPDSLSTSDAGGASAATDGSLTLSWILPALDTTAPTTPGSFTGVPSSPTKLTGATVGFTLGESGGTVECRVDAGAWGSCTSVTGTAGSQSLSGLADGSHTVSVRQTDAAGNVSQVGTTTSWTVDTTVPPAPISVPTVLTVSSATKTVYKKTVDGKGVWAMKVALLFSTGGDTRAAAQILTVQVAVDKDGKPVSAKPSDSQALPSSATYAQGVVAWSASGEVVRQSVDAPVWVRVGNKSGKWTGWVKLVK